MAAVKKSITISTTCLFPLCSKQMQTEHRTTLVKKDREVQRLQRELECAQQQCETLKKEAMPVRHAREHQTASGSQRRVLLEQNSTAEKPAAAVAKPTAMTSTIMPLNRYVSVLSTWSAFTTHVIETIW